MVSAGNISKMSCHSDNLANLSLKFSEIPVFFLSTIALFSGVQWVYFHEIEILKQAGRPL
jgi:hypothetical protein